jgi:hypothetical protein
MTPNDPPPESPNAPPTLRLGQRLALALVPLALLLGSTELLLTLFDLAPGDNAYFSRGFDDSARYLVPDPDVQGGWVTRIYDGLNPELEVPPKGARRRVLLLGGSNTRRLAEAYLQQRLSDLSPEQHPGWEVFNLGREGYGSERVAILLEQALVLEPDVVVVYSGHNEFIERRFADELDSSMSFWEREIAFGLSNLRSFRLLKGLWASEPPPRDTSRESDDRPEDFQLAIKTFNTMTWTGTLRYLEAFRRNLARLSARATDAGTSVVLCTLVSNDFAPPVLSNARRELVLDKRLELSDLRDLSILEEPDSPWAGLDLTRRLRWPEWSRDRPWRDPFEPPLLRPLSGRLALTPATVGPLDSVMGAHWTDPDRWSILTIECLTAFRRLLDRELDEEWRAICEQHVEECGRALLISPDDPKARYDLGLCLWLLGEDDARAAELLRAAAASDRLPLAANAPINTIVREVVAAAGNIALVDADQLFRARCPDGLIGFEVMMDHCHLQPGAGHVLLQDIADVVLEIDGN